MKALKMEVMRLTQQLQLLGGASSVSDEELNQWARKSRTIQAIKKIPGDASQRRYYRVFTKDRTFILMRMEPFSKLKKRHPFLETQEHLARRGIAVPEVYEFSAEQGFVLLQDLGDSTLLHRLKSVSDLPTERKLYEQAIDLLVEFQLRSGPKTLKKNEKRISGFRIGFDLERLMWEVNHTIEHFYERYLNRKLKVRDRSLMLRGFTEICEVIAGQPKVFVHRDFHSRNIMALPQRNKAEKSSVKKKKLSEEKLYMIDFQDARMGPAQYDLASLLKDSYYQLQETQIVNLCDYYLTRYQALSRRNRQIGRDQFFYIFDLVSIQRNFKAIGSFASFLNNRDNATYLKYIGNTFENIRRVLLRHPRLTKLREVLFHYYYF